jgi:hypothetical protein
LLRFLANQDNANNVNNDMQYHNIGRKRAEKLKRKEDQRRLHEWRQMERQERLAMDAVNHHDELQRREYDQYADSERASKDRQQIQSRQLEMRRRQEGRDRMDRLQSVKAIESVQQRRDLVDALIDPIGTCVIRRARLKPHGTHSQCF